MTTTKTKKGKRLAVHIRVRRAMEKNGIKKVALCAKLGISRPTLNTYLKHGGFNRRHITILKKERLIK